MKLPANTPGSKGHFFKGKTHREKKLKKQWRGKRMGKIHQGKNRIERSHNTS